MSYDIGPFQEITKISFGGDSDPEDFTYDEEALGRTDCSDAATEYNTGGVIRPFDEVTRLCICENDPAFSGGHTVKGMQVLIPITAAWPACIIGATSGAKIAAGWPDAPEGWGTGAPEAYIEPAQMFCTTAYQEQGTPVLGTYYITMTWLVECKENIYENCC